MLAEDVRIAAVHTLWHLYVVFERQGKVTMDHDEYNVNCLDLPKIF